MKMTAVYQEVRGGYVGFVEELPGANTQGRTLAEVRRNLAEAVELVLDANRRLKEIWSAVAKTPLWMPSKQARRFSE